MSSHVTSSAAVDGGQRWVVGDAGEGKSLVAWKHSFVCPQDARLSTVFVDLAMPGGGGGGANVRSFPQLDLTLPDPNPPPPHPWHACAFGDVCTRTPFPAPAPLVQGQFLSPRQGRSESTLL